MKYRKKPIVIEAVQYVKGDESFFDWIKAEKVSYFYRCEQGGNKLMVKTLEGDMHVSPDDFLIKGIKGEFYPCKPDIFEATYEKVEEQ